MEYWKGDITQWDIETLRMKDTGHGIVLKNKVRAYAWMGSGVCLSTAHTHS